MAQIAIFGVTGRMGQTLVRALREARGPLGGDSVAAAPVLCGAIASPRSIHVGHDAALDGAPLGVVIAGEPSAALAGATVAIDFSLPDAVSGNALACARAGVPLLVGTTGFDAAVQADLQRESARIAVLIAPNTSLGANVVARLVQAAARLLVQADVEIVEAHHRGKRDAPSGTALALGEVIARARGVSLADVAVFDRHGAGRRRLGDIGFSSLRAGDIVGEHTVTFALGGERVEITHRATDRSTFALGALRAAAWLAGKGPGLYTMDDVLGPVTDAQTAAEAIDSARLDG